jgi:23S rRNA pseudouridine1911/1915/1917 synthase
MILYEDNHLLVAVKPQNMPSQADASGDEDFLSFLKKYIKEKYGKLGNVYLGLVHRLDRPAGGVMVFARTSKAAARLTRQIQAFSMQKKYAAIITTPLAPSGDLADYLLKDKKTNTTRIVPKGTAGAKLAMLHYDVACISDGYTLLNINLMTGRSHQIRVQLAGAGAPLAGDVKYGGPPAPNLCLWSRELSLDHPVTGERLTFRAPLPSLSPWDKFSNYF